MPTSRRVEPVAAPHEHHLTVPRTARYFTLGEARRAVWLVVHGYGELAGEFAARFAPVDDGTRLIVAPEGLSRFYHALPSPPASATTGDRGAIGASWMTREDRDGEIGDQVTFLDLVHERIFARVPRDAVRLTVLGFSQGVATICRWLARSTVRPDRIVCWAGLIPEETLGALHGPALTIVAGERDAYAPADRVAETEGRLAGAGLTFNRLTFAGGHRLDDDVLRTLAADDGTDPPPRI